MGYLSSCKTDSSTTIQNPQNPNPKRKIQQFNYHDVESATKNFSDQNLLGKGSHGSVYKAFLNGRHVAVKRPSLKSPSEVPEIDNELEILSEIHSPRLVNLIGTTSHKSQRRLLIVEYMRNGTLYDAIHGNKSQSLSWSRRIRIALQVARAIETLHSANVIHRDVKSANVLLDDKWNGRLGDLGLAIRCHVEGGLTLTPPPAGTMGYLDPSYVSAESLSTKLDVFSFGILVLEIISGRKAIDVSHSPPSILEWAIPLIKRGKVGLVYDPRIGPPRDRDGIVNRQLAVIAAKCVRSCRERRPTMRDVAGWLARLSKLVPVGPWNSIHGLNNPCLMVENVGQPVELASSKNGLENTKQITRNSRRVYSDLGFSSNLMELMAGSADDDDNSSESNRSKLMNWVFSGGSERFGVREKSNVNLRRNFSIGGTSSSSVICSKIDDIVPRGSFRSQGVAGDS